MPSIQDAYYEGLSEAMRQFGLKTAAEEIRLQIGRRKFHGVDKAVKTETKKSLKSANDLFMPEIPELPPAPDADTFTQALDQFNGMPKAPTDSVATDHLDRQTMWSGPSHLGENANMGNV